MKKLNQAIGTVFTLLALSFPSSNVVAHSNECHLCDINWEAPNIGLITDNKQIKTVQNFYQLLSDYVNKNSHTGEEFISIPLAELRIYDPILSLPNDYISHEWIDLDSDDTLELIVTSDPSGRGFHTINIFFKDKDTISFQYFDIGRGGLFTTKIFNDLDSDKKIELTIERTMGSYRGSELPVSVPFIYGLDGNKFIEMTSKFTHLYKPTFLKTITEKEQEALVGCEEQGIEHNNTCANLVAIRASKFLFLLKLGEPLTDFDYQAVLEWRNSTNPNIRNHAVTVLQMLNRAQ